MSKRMVLILAASTALAAGCQQSDEGDRNAATAKTATGAKEGAGLPNSTIAQELAGSKDHSTLTQAIKAAGLEATMAGSQPYTLFAPTNDAFGKLPGGSADDLLKAESKARLTAILTNHLVPGVVTVQDLSKAIEKGGGRTQLATMGGSTLTVGKEGNSIVLTDAKGGKSKLAGAEQMQSNGVVHSVDGILSPG